MAIFWTFWWNTGKKEQKREKDGKIKPDYIPKFVLWSGFFSFKEIELVIFGRRQFEIGEIINGSWFEVCC